MTAADPGNDRKAREAANTLWVSKPQETAEFIGCAGQGRVRPTG